MGISENYYHDLLYYRVYRAWGGKEFQEYVRIKRSKPAAYKKAELIDKRLAKGQKAYYTATALTPKHHINSDGRIRGQRRIIVNHKGREATEVFALRVKVPWEENVNMTTFSISVHGVDKAFNNSIHQILEWYGLTTNSAVYNSMQDALPVYNDKTV